MFRLHANSPSVGIEITSTAVRLAAVSARRGGLSVSYTNSADLSAGIVTAGFATPNVRDQAALTEVLRRCLSDAGRSGRRAALSLPDGVFRVQTIEFDEFPAKSADRERLIRWRLDKTAAFDLSDTVLRYQILQRRGSGLTVLVCAAKKAVIEQYEAVLLSLGLEPWSIGVSSFNILNLYSPVIRKKSPVYAFAHLTEDSFVTVVMESAGARFYRFKEVKRGNPEEIRARHMREIEDSLHFYMHMDRTQTSEIQNLYLTGEATLPYDLAEGLSTSTSLCVEVLTPADVMAGNGGSADASAWLAAMAPALGAGSAL